ncbi:Uncharacterised protein [uncultured archaeon]|nr:Uncharacterised protein [uncultured archaeon]
MKKARIPTSSSGKTGMKLFHCDYTGKWITRREIKAEKKVGKKHRMISKEAWMNPKLKLMYRHNEEVPPFQLE